MFILVVEFFFSHLLPPGIEPETVLRTAIQVMLNVTHKWMSPLQLNFNNCPIYTHDCANVKLSTSGETLNEVTVMALTLY
jgi:hypothetical protein